VRVVVVDREPVRAEGIRHVLTRAGGLEVVGSAATGAEAMRLIREHRPEVLIVDGGYLDARGVAGARRLRAAFPEVHLLVLVGGDDPVPRSELAPLGLGHSVCKTAAVEEIVRAVRAVAAGGTVGRTGDSATGTPPQSRPGANRHGLTARELEIVGLLDRGWRNKEIAAALVLTERTVEFHVGRILTKLGARSRGEAAARARQGGINLLGGRGSAA
jgi:DNA-binding NarL/FixJ family response regulator